MLCKVFFKYDCQKKMKETKKKGLQMLLQLEQYRQQ